MMTQQQETKPKTQKEKAELQHLRHIKKKKKCLETQKEIYKLRSPTSLEDLDVSGAPERSQSLGGRRSQYELVVESSNGGSNEGSDPKDPLEKRQTH